MVIKEKGSVSFAVAEGKGASEVKMTKRQTRNADIILLKFIIPPM